MLRYRSAYADPCTDLSIELLQMRRGLPFDVGIADLLACNPFP